MKSAVFFFFFAFEEAAGISVRQEHNDIILPGSYKPGTSFLQPLIPCCMGEKEEEKLGSLAALWHDFRENSEAFLAVVVLVSLALSVGLLVFLRYLLDRNRAFVFPDAQGSPLLGAPHAPGVGSVISYHNRTQPPSIQRNNYPDYLQRM